MDNKKDIELRSEKVRNIVGKIPPVILRIGVAIISTVIMIVLVLMYFVPYPQYYCVDIDIISIPEYHLVKAPADGLYYKNNENNSSVGIILSSDSIFQVKADNEGKLITNYCDSSYIYKNDIIAVVIPDTTISFSGICKVPANMKSKIKPGQNVIIALSSGEECTASVFNIDNFQQRDNSAKYPYYKIHIKLNCQLNWFQLSVGKVEGKILISEKPVLQSILHSNY